MAFKGDSVGNWHFTIATVVSALAAFIAFATITPITVTTAAFAWLALLFVAWLCAGHKTLALCRGLLTGWIQGLRRVVHRCAYHVITVAFGAVIAALATTATTLAALTTTLTSLGALTVWCV